MSKAVRVALVSGCLVALGAGVASAGGHGDSHKRHSGDKKCRDHRWKCPSPPKPPKPPKPKQQLTVSLTGNGSGTVTSSPSGINCAADCSEAYSHGTKVKLTASPDASSRFAGWSGACRGTRSCVVEMDKARSVTAKFVLREHRLHVFRSGNGTGSVTSSPGGINCGFDCSQSYDHGTGVTLTATPGANSNFAGWSGACSGTGTCVVSMTQTRFVTATFTRQTPPQQFQLAVTKGGDGSGTVLSNGIAGIDCGSDCSENYNAGQSVTLTATPAAGSSFAGWSGDCTGTGPCTVTMTQARSVTATFNLVPPPIRHTVSGSPAPAEGGSVSAASSSVEADCAGGSCTVDEGASVDLTATPNSGYRFGSWSGDCTGSTASISVTADASKSCTANFIRQFTIAAVAGPNGSVGAQVGATTCPGASCTVDQGTSVHLTATPDAGYDFAGWTGAGCTPAGNNPLLRVANADASCTASFTQQIPQFMLTASKAGNGTGTVTSSPSGIACDRFCMSDSHFYNQGQIVTLTAIPGTGSNFTGWSGEGCSGTGQCQVTMDQARHVTATFTLQQFTLTVDGSWNGTFPNNFGGKVEGPGIDCGTSPSLPEATDCSETYNYGTVVTLTATGDDTAFSSWSGDCSGTNPVCVLTIDGNKSVFAAFQFQPGG